VDFCAWLKVIVTPLVMKPSDIDVVVVHRSGVRLSLGLRVALDDVGRVCGKRGQTINALRTVAAAAGGLHGLRVSLDLNDEIGAG
jgi:predicted RNA-binding protein YlqC (UPF0109 family)